MGAQLWEFRWLGGLILPYIGNQQQHILQINVTRQPAWWLPVDKRRTSTGQASELLVPRPMEVSETSGSGFLSSNMVLI